MAGRYFFAFMLVLIKLGEGKGIGDDTVALNEICYAYVEVVCGLYRIAEFHCNLNLSSLIQPSILWTVTNIMNTSQRITGEQISFNKEFQINCTEEYENVTVQCMVLDTANLIIYGDLITVRIQGKLTT